MRVKTDIEICCQIQDYFPQVNIRKKKCENYCRDAKYGNIIDNYIIVYGKYVLRYLHQDKNTSLQYICIRGAFSYKNYVLNICTRFYCKCLYQIQNWRVQPTHSQILVSIILKKENAALTYLQMSIYVSMMSQTTNDEINVPALKVVKINNDRFTKCKWVQKSMRKTTFVLI